MLFLQIGIGLFLLHQGLTGRVHLTFAEVVVLPEDLIFDNGRLLLSDSRSVAVNLNVFITSKNIGEYGRVCLSTTKVVLELNNILF